MCRLDVVGGTAEEALLPGQRLNWRAISQLAAVWLTFVISSGVYHLPATLLAGSCPNVSHPCSLAEEFPAESSTALGWLPATFLLVKCFLALPAGEALRHFGERACILTGTVLLVLSTGLFGTVSAFWMLPIVYALMGVSFCLSGLTPVVCFTNTWFDEGKATTIGLVVTGFAVAGMLWPAVGAAVAEKYGWRVAAALLPGAALIFALPISACVLRNGPHGSHGQERPRGEGCSPHSQDCRPHGQRPSMRTHEHDSPVAIEMIHADRRDARTSDSSGRAVGSPRPAKSDAGALGLSALVHTLRHASWARDTAMWRLLGMTMLTLAIVNGTQVRHLPRSPHTSPYLLHAPPRTSTYLP